MYSQGLPKINKVLWTVHTRKKNKSVSMKYIGKFQRKWGVTYMCVIVHYLKSNCRSLNMPKDNYKTTRLVLQICSPWTIRKPKGQWRYYSDVVSAIFENSQYINLIFSLWTLCRHLQSHIFFFFILSTFMAHEKRLG